MEESLADIRIKADEKSQREWALVEQLMVVRAQESMLLDEISKVREGLRILRAKATERVNFTTASYISRLPNELLSKIFQDAQDHDGDPRIELCVSQVCQRWRTIAFNCSSLWRTIHISPTTLALAGMYLVRSGQQLVDMRLDYSFERDASARHMLAKSTEMAEEALWCIDRWQRLSIKASHDIENLLYHFVPLFAPSLQHISISIPRKSRSPLTLLEGGAPKLTSLALTNILPHYLNVPFSRKDLSSLTLVADCVRYGTFCDILLALPSLTQLTLDRSDFPVQPGALENHQMRKVVMPNLRSLSVMDYSHAKNCMFAILKTISAPILENFTLQFYKDFRDTGGPIVPFLRDPPVPICPSLNSLTLHLHLRGLGMLFWLIAALPDDVGSIILYHDNMLMRTLLLNAMPHTEEYTWPPPVLPIDVDPNDSDDEYDASDVQFSDDTMWVYHRIRTTYGERLLWPKLHTLVFKDKEPLGSFYSLLRLLKARKEAGRPISVLKFQGDGKEFSPSFREMVTNGLSRYVDTIEFE